MFCFGRGRQRLRATRGAQGMDFCTWAQGRRAEDFSRRSAVSDHDSRFTQVLPGQNLICQHLVSRPIRDLISTAPLVLTASPIDAKRISVSCLEEASVLTIRRVCSNADDHLAADLNRLQSHYGRLGEQET